jgi:transcriptional regulator of acetoin/glycerol metabolism
MVLGSDHALATQVASLDDLEAQLGDLPKVPLDVPFKEIRDRLLDHLEQEYVRGLLDRHGGNVSAVAQAAGLSRTYVHRLIRKHRL